MKLGIEIITGRFFYVEIGDGETVGGLKKEIAKTEEDLGEQEQRMLLMHSDGRLLRDDNSALSSYGCCDGSILYLFLHPIGPSPWPSLFEDRLIVHIKEGQQ